MKIRNPKSEIRSGFGVAAALLAVLPLYAATNSALLDEKLALSPPHAELPPTFWEQYGAWLVLGFVLILVLALVLWLLLRPGPPAPTPIEVQARQELEALRRQSEDGRTLSQVSRSLRRYLAVAFELPPDELTTTEFVRVLGASEKIGPDLAVKVTGFLQRCDELKFAPAGPPPQTGAAARALELVESGEARRVQLRAATTATG